MRKELLGKNIEFEAISIPCPVCGRTFNTEAGMKQHVRLQHSDGVDTAKPKKKKKAPSKKKSSKKTSKKGSKKKT
jgi:uncharacterized Zn finger protein (UPF0148 family)